ncbi:MAG: hypothetical protein IPJ58_09645 [Ardenticatenia bacterium]|nr:hypothetical protein [Ardenticatenia bacterium]
MTLDLIDEAESSDNRSTECELSSDDREVYLREYEKLKDEQLSRIGFRDNLIYVTLGVVGGVSSFALSTPRNLAAILVVPWVCFVLGWSYISNDQKVTAIRDYLRGPWRTAVATSSSLQMCRILMWEDESISNHQRSNRMGMQLFTDIATFIMPGLVAVVTYAFSSHDPTAPVRFIVVADGGLLAILLLRLTSNSRS